MKKNYDLVVLGGGPAGYLAAIRASQLGFKTAIVEKNQLGGTCLHSGCIPSKTLLRSAEVFQTIKTSEQYGIKVTDPTFNLSKIQERKKSIIKKLHQGIQHLMKKGQIDLIYGHGRILGPSIFSPLAGTISVRLNKSDENITLTPNNLILATGSKPSSLPEININGQNIITSEQALELKRLPKSIIIVGGGVIGVEWASLLADLEVDVTLLEYDVQILPSEDKEVAQELKINLENKGVKIFTNTKVSKCESINEISVQLFAENNQGQAVYKAEKVLLAVGREANLANIGLENTDIKITDGVIETNEFYQTAESHIYAVGDVIAGPQLAHVASREGIIAVEHLAGLKVLPIDYNSVPRCIYTSPEIGAVGLTEQEARNKGFKVKVASFPFAANGKALLFGQSAGFVKIISDDKTKDLLGVHIIGPQATELVSEVGLAKVLDATAWEISNFIHPHPSLSEAINEAALSIDGKALHI